MTNQMHSDSWTGSDRSQREAGSALVVALWVIALLSLLISAFAVDMHLEARITSYQKKRLKSEYLARAGIERVEWLIAKSQDVNPKEPDYEVISDSWFPRAAQLKQASTLVIHEELGEGEMEISIKPEPARRNVNQLSANDWRKVLEVGDIPEEMWDDLIASVLDWMDGNNDKQDGGAENDYYESLEEPYKTKNGPLDTVEELLLVKGFTRSILFSGPIDPDAEEGLNVSGIADMLTVFGDGKVNVNAAPRRVLMTLEGMNEVSADDLLAERSGEYLEDDSDESPFFENMSDVFERVPGLAQELSAVLTTVSQIYRVSSKGNWGEVDHRISCIVQARPKGMRVIRWLEGDEFSREQ